MLRLNTQHWSLRQRLYVIAIAAGLCTLFSVTANLFTISDYDRNAEHISHGELLKLGQIAHSLRELSDTHTNLFNLLRVAGKKTSEQQIYLQGSKLIDRLDRLHKYLDSGKHTSILDKQGKPYQHHFLDVIRELKIYRNASSVAIEMLTVNPALSEKYMLKATGSFNKLNQSLTAKMSEVSEHIHHELEEELELINRIYWPMSIFIIFVAALMAPLIFKLLRDLSLNFEWFESTLNDLRTGNTDISIPDNHPDREMDRIYRSLNQFRSTLIKLRDSQTALSEKNQLLLEESERRVLTEKELRRSLTELSKAIDAAEASSKAKSLFLANMSHEIRTPLNAVLGMAQVLQTTTLNDDQTEYVDTLYKQGHHLLQLLNSVLDYSRMESGKLSLHYQAFELDKLLADISGLYKIESDHKNISFKIDIDPAVENQMFGDPLRLRQILINLLSNAYKFTERGEIRLHIENSPGKPDCIDVRPEQCPNNRPGKDCHWRSLYITVSDTGIGIAKDKQEYIFNNFTQADESTTREYGGTGIGLAICKQLVELMDGEIGVTSEPGQGATFWFRICLPNMGCIEQQHSA